MDAGTRAGEAPQGADARATPQPARSRAWNLIARLLLAIAGLASAAVALLSGGMYYTLYWRYRGLFEAGRYFDPVENVVHHDDAAFLLAPTLAAALLALLFAVLCWRSGRSRVQKASRSRPPR